jgi:hypothetical protein
VSSGVQLGNSPEGNAEHTFENSNTLHPIYAFTFIFTFDSALRNSPATINLL